MVWNQIRLIKPSVNLLILRPIYIIFIYVSYIILKVFKMIKINH